MISNNILIPLLLLAINIFLGMISYTVRSFIKRIETTEKKTETLNLEFVATKTKVDNHEQRITKLEQ